MQSMLLSSSQFPHRVLATNIPLHISNEQFYDTLRSYTGGVGVHNALLIQIPMKNTHSLIKATPTYINKCDSNQDQTSLSDRNNLDDNDICMSGKQGIYRHKRNNLNGHNVNKRLREQSNAVCFQKHWTSDLSRAVTRNTGAALIDFVSKKFAQMMMQTGMVIEGNEVHWESVGSVIPTIGSLAAAQHNDAQKMRLIGKKVYSVSSMKVYTSNNHETNFVAKYQQDNSPKTNNFCDDCCVNRLYTVNEQCAKDEQIVRLIWQSQDAKSANKICYRSQSSIERFDAHKSNWDATSDIRMQNQQYVQLYTSFDNAVRRITGRHIYSLEVLCQSQVHLITNKQTAQLLKEERYIDVQMCKSIFSVTAQPEDLTDKNKITKKWKIISTPRQRVDTLMLFKPTVLKKLDNKNECAYGSDDEVKYDDGRSNVKLCAKSQVMNAMVRLMTWSKGKVCAVKDRYGNVLLPNNY